VTNERAHNKQRRPVGPPRNSIQSLRSGPVEFSRRVAGDLEANLLLRHFRLVPFKLHGNLRVAMSRTVEHHSQCVIFDPQRSTSDAPLTLARFVFDAAL
jgi:hypothetical protein